MDTCYNMDELENIYIQWKNPVTENHVLQDSIDRKCPESANPQSWQGEPSLGPGTGGDGRGGCGVSFGIHENTLTFMVVIVTQLCEYTESHQVVDFKRANW